MDTLPTLADKISDRIRNLPVEQQKRVLEYIEGIGKPHRTLMEIVREIKESIPDEVLEQLPRDGSLNHDHYLYGAPKK